MYWVHFVVDVKMTLPDTALYDEDFDADAEEKQ